MKVWTDDFRRFGKTLNIIDQKVTFDKKGCAEVDDTFGKNVLKVYKGVFFKEEPKFEEPSVAETTDIDSSEDKITVDALKQEIEQYKNTLNRKYSELSIVTKEFEEFKILFDELQGKYNELSERKEEIETVTTGSTDLLQDKYSLALKGLGGCKAVCRQMNLPEADYKEQKDLEKLIDYIISKAN
jgi:hypothetical protein